MLGIGLQGPHRMEEKNKKLADRAQHLNKERSGQLTMMAIIGIPLGSFLGIGG